MKLNENQSYIFLEEANSPSTLNNLVERNALQEAEERKNDDSYLAIHSTLSEEEVDQEEKRHHLFSTIVPNQEEKTFYMPVHCPRCRDHAWYRYDTASLYMIGISGMPAICRKCKCIFSPPRHVGHFKTLKKFSIGCLVTILLLISLIICAMA